MKKIISFIAICLTGLFFSQLWGQDTLFNPLKNGVKYNFSEDGKYSFNFGLSAQLWMRYTQLNPNTKNLQGKDISSDFDFLIRRNTYSTQISLDKFTFFTTIGMNSQTSTTSVGPFTQSKPQIFMYDLFGSYAFFNKNLIIGYGIHLYHGLSRYSSASSSRTLGADVPALAAPDVLTTEQIARVLGLFLAGNIGKISYRFTLANPFWVDSPNRPPVGLYKASDIPNNNLKSEGYVTFQFLDKERNVMPFTSATYLGNKKVFNIGAGFAYHPKSTGSLTEFGDTIIHDKLHLAADVFLDLPFTGGGALTFYGAYFKYNYGPNYTISGGTANNYKGISPAGAGNSEPGFGTGQATAVQVAWLFPKIIGKGGRMQAYYEGDYRFYEALDDPALHHNIGLNYFIFNHNLKLTLQNEFRPYFEGPKKVSYKSLSIFKMQISI
jgi:hypothetical protein